MIQKATAERCKARGCRWMELCCWPKLWCQDWSYFWYTSCWWYLFKCWILNFEPWIEIINKNDIINNFCTTYFLLTMTSFDICRYRISANSFRGNYSFLEVWVRQVFKGGNYSREETIVFLLFRGGNYMRKLE